MVIDIFLYGIINGYNNGIINILEYIIIMTFVSIFFYISYKDFNELDESIQVFLMLLRFILQCLRFMVGVIRF